MSGLAILAVNVAILSAAILLLWRYCIAIRDVSVIDAFWPFGMVMMVTSTFVLAHGAPARKALLLTLTAIWGLRLATHLFVRWRAHGVDPRYAAILGRLMEKTGWSFAKASFIQVFALQAVLLFIVCLPAQVGQFSSAPLTLGWMAFAGAGMTIVGILFEAVGDAQLTAFRGDPAKKGLVLDTGLWRYTRHPNYFGDALSWWGIWLVAFEGGAGLWTMMCPLLITWLVTRLSGVPMLERSLRKSRPGYDAYVRRTSAFFPWPPKAD
jgi:steroid 5-alpha reductase family enzyme